MADPDGIVWDDAPAPTQGAAVPDDSIQWDAPADFSNVRAGAMSHLAAPEPSWWDKAKAKAGEIGENIATGTKALVEGGDYEGGSTDKRTLIGVPEGLARESYDVLTGFADSTLKAANPLAAPLIDEFLGKGHAALGNDENTTRFESPRAEFAARAIPDFLANLVPLGEGAKAMGEIATEGRASQAFEPALRGELGPEAQGAATAHAVMDEAEKTVQADTAGIADAAQPELPPVPPEAAVAEHPAPTVDAAASPIDVPSEAPPAAPVADMAPDTNPITERFAQKLSDHPAAAEEYAAIPETQGGTVLNTDTARELSPDYLNDRTKSADVHEPASAFIKKLYAEKLEAPTPEGKDPVVMFTAGGTGAGKTSSLPQGIRRVNPEITYDTNMNRFSTAKAKIDAALNAPQPREVIVRYTYRDPVEALRNGALPRAARQEAQFGTGRTVPLQEHINTHVGSSETVRQLALHYADNPHVVFEAIDNSRGKGNSRVTSLDALPKVEQNGLHERLIEQLDQARQNGEISDAVHRGFASDSQRVRADFDQRSGQHIEPQNARSPRAAGRNDQPTPQEPVTGIKNAQVAQERANLGLEAVKHDLARTDKASWAAEEARARDNPTYGRDLADSLVEKPRAISKEEVFALTIDRARIRNERREAYAQAERALDAGDAESAAAWRARTDRLDEEMERNDIAGRVTGHEQAEGLRARQRMAKEDYSMAALVQRAKVRKGEALTPAEKAKWEGIAKDIEKREAALAERERAVQEAKTKPRTRATVEAKSRFDSVAEKLRNSARTLLCEVA